MRTGQAGSQGNQPLMCPNSGVTYKTEWIR